MGIDEQIQFLIQMSNLLNRLYESGMVYGDLNPSSIFVEQRLVDDKKQVSYSIDLVPLIFGINSYKRIISEDSEKLYLPPEMMSVYTSHDFK